MLPFATKPMSSLVNNIVFDVAFPALTALSKEVPNFSLAGTPESVISLVTLLYANIVIFGLVKSFFTLTGEMYTPPDVVTSNSTFEALNTIVLSA